MSFDMKITSWCARRRTRGAEGARDAVRPGLD
jgi:hypothetical protein